MKKSYLRLKNTCQKEFEKIKPFYLYIKKHPLARLNFILILSLFLLIPSFNSNLNQAIAKKETILRSSSIKLPAEKNLIMDQKINTPMISAQGIYIWDLGKQSLLYSKNADKHFYPASTTKIVSAMVGLKHWQSKQIITIPPVSSIGQVLGIRVGEQYYFDDLLYGLLVQSGNDVASALALSYPGGYDAFVRQMNREVDSLNLLDTNFANPSGIDHWQHYASPHDLAIISQNALNNPLFTQAIATKNYDLTDVSGEHIIQLENINELLGEEDGVKGIKTGWTELAGECLLSLVERDGREIVIVVMQSQDRFGDSKQLIAWTFDNFTLVENFIN